MIIYKHIRSITKRMAFLFFTAVFLLNTGCMDNLLDTSPYDKLGTGNMWTSDYLTDLGMAGAYEPLRDGYNISGSASGRTLYQTDRWGLTGQTTNTDSWQAGTITSGDGLFSNVWKAMYTGIHRCNDVIHNMPGVSPSTDEKKARYIAEAKFLRAYYYFRLNQVFKGVPVYLEEVVLDEMIRPRESEDQVWQVIIDDLTEAINEPNLPDKYAAGDSDYGHVTKGAAYALRGKTYLYMKEYAKAVADFEKVGQCGYALFQGNYKALFKEANEQCEEMIFSIQNTGTSGYGSDTQFYCGNRSSFGSCWNNYLVAPDMVDLYENIDGSKFNWDDIIPGYNSMSLADRQIFFIRNKTDNELVVKAIETIENAGKLDFSLYLPDGNEERVKKAYENRDPRLNANIITPYSEYVGIVEGTTTSYTYISRWPYVTRNEPVGDLETDTTPFYYYLHRKFVYEGGNELLNRVYGPIDHPIIRYADVLLMWAEALAESDAGINAKAIELVNMVRQRAGVALLNSNEHTQVTSRENLIERIRNERRYEFVNEGINYFDEVRWRTLKDIAYYEGSGIKQVWGENKAPYVWIGDHAYTWAIPRAEIQRNPNIEQNPGWGN